MYSSGIRFSDIPVFQGLFCRRYIEIAGFFNGIPLETVIETLPFAPRARLTSLDYLLLAKKLNNDSTNDSLKIKELESSFSRKGDKKLLFIKSQQKYF